MLAALAVSLVVPPLAGLLLEGVRRKLRARIQGRVGPPIVQPFYDVAKLFCKRPTVPRCASWATYSVAPLLALAGAWVAAFMVPQGLRPALSFYGDVVAVVVLLFLSAAMVAVGGFASGNPYAALGASRLVAMLLVLEVPVALFVASIAVQTGDLRLVETARQAFFIKNPLAVAAFALYAMGKLRLNPFSMPEAETEILEGPLVEYGGPGLALFELAHAIETYVLVSILASTVIPPMSLAGLVAHLALCATIVAVFTLVECLVARLRLDQALRFYAVYSTLLGLAGLALAVLWGGVT